MFQIKLEGISTKEKNDFFAELSKRKELLKTFKKNLIELEDLEIKIEQVLDEINFIN